MQNFSQISVTLPKSSTTSLFLVVLMYLLYVFYQDRLQDLYDQVYIQLPIIQLMVPYILLTIVSELILSYTFRE